MAGYPAKVNAKEGWIIDKLDQEKGREEDFSSSSEYDGADQDIVYQDEYSDEQYLDEQNKTSKTGNKKGLWAAAAFAIPLLTKGKFIIIFLLSKFKFLFVFLKLSKFATTAVSMVATIWIYAVFYGAKFALGFVALLFIHEMGHYFTAKRVGLAVSGPVFIPFVGALIGMKENPKDAVTEAQVGYGGPLFGSLAAVLCLMLYWFTGYELALALAYVGFFLNIFNLLPVHPLDGGRIVSAVSPYLWLVGIPVLIYLMIKSFNPILLIIVFLGLVQVYNLWKKRHDLSAYYQVPLKERVQFAILYFGLVGSLAMGLTYTLELLA
ncbi:site-2 protease family protein [Desulfitobacterium sp. PCE1]|uniref:site-2 protease family protein n=1 Tax=Desulfitobacterium sp. PCE1 TaxID=146907 RepID=UPI00036294D3|nr:site-2 protease family protein [Desulfitobacterium sp. PCE1]